MTGLRLTRALLALACLSGCAAHPRPTGRWSFGPADEYGVRLFGSAWFNNDDLIGCWHPSEGLDIEAGEGQGQVFACDWGRVQVGTWRDGAPVGPVELRFADYTRFRGAVGEDGRLEGTLFVLVKGTDGYVGVPRYQGGWRLDEAGVYQPHRGRWFDLEGTHVVSWKHGLGGPSSWEGEVSHSVVTRESLDPATIEGRREWSATFVQGQRQGLARTFDRSGEVVSETTYLDGVPSGLSWHQAGARRWVLDHRDERLTLASIEHTDGPIRRESFWLEPREVGDLIQGWVCVEPREGKPYLIWRDVAGKSVEATRRPLPAGCGQFEDLFESWRPARAADNKLWLGQCNYADGFAGWGRLYQGNQGLRFEEGYFLARGPVGFSSFAESQSTERRFRMLELRRDGETVTDIEGLEVILATDVDAQDRARWAAEAERERQAALEREHAMREAIEAVTRRPSDYRAVPVPSQGVVRWSNGAVFKGTPVTDMTRLSPGAVIWLRTKTHVGFVSVESVLRQGLLVVGVPRPIEADTVDELRVFGSLPGAKFRKECVYCDARGYTVHTLGTSGRAKIDVTYVHQFGETTRTEEVQTSGFEDVRSACDECDGRGGDLGAWASWRTR